MEKKWLLKRKKIRTSKLPIALSFKLESHREGTATILESIFDYMKNGLMITKPGSDYDIYRDGLKTQR
jgi:penicillin-binding protein 1A